MTVKASDLRELLLSDLPDPTLVLIGGRLEVIKVDDLDADDFRDAVLLLSRTELLARGVDETSPDDVLERQAATICTAVADLDPARSQPTTRSPSTAESRTPDRPSPAARPNSGIATGPP
ncbi:hypothetical protein [Saccharothrix texasensis]|uniref:Uncharacterized protein n=1 Tax=Saccharothrix texasensis TaxID=103734 RepID=A0A3N1H6T0_9PSEU|nr:hypothetical protein [Saccharothrix texasensis]ROP37942.1 hypothetical protein EDD40_3272 [Saccharothrix texasensis]